MGTREPRTGRKGSHNGARMSILARSRVSSTVSVVPACRASMADWGLASASSYPRLTALVNRPTISSRSLKFVSFVISRCS